MSLTIFIDDICPKCSKPINFSFIEPHPTCSDLAVHNFTCGDCGTVKTKIISLGPGKPRLQAAAVQSLPSKTKTSTITSTRPSPPPP
jgi:hypothetical protein